MGKDSKNTSSSSYITVPSEIINSLSSSSLNTLLLTYHHHHPPKRGGHHHHNHNHHSAAAFRLLKNTKLYFLLLILFLFGFLGMVFLYYSDLTLSANPCTLPPSPHHHHSFAVNDTVEATSFWKQPDGLGYKPCLEFTPQYAAEGAVLKKDRSRYLMVVVSGGMNQQRNQIVDAVVIARILGAALVAPVLQVNVVWGDESEFSDIFDVEHFKRVLADDVRIVSSLPSTHLRTRPLEESQTPFHASPRWIRQHYLPKLRRNGVLLLRGLDSRLSKDLPSDLQKLRCKVAFHALKFAPHIQSLGDKVAERMSSKGPYVALHLRMEKDVWIRTGCSPGLSSEYDELVNNERKQSPKLLTGKSNMTAHERKLAGLCPLNALDVARLLKALGAPKSARIYWAGGEPLGGRDALLPLTREFPFFYSKEDLALPGELQPVASRASSLAAIDYIVCEKSDVFMASHGGNMGRAIQGHRAYAGHKKHITPNKRHMLPYFVNSSLPETEFNNIVKELHQDSLGQPELRTSKPGRDVTKYPVPECMCN